MDKKLLKEFAMKSRVALHDTIRAKLTAMNVTESANWTQNGELYQANINGKNVVLSADEKSRYDKLQAAVKSEGIKAIVEKAAYTWFNRIVAIRYMELNEILPESRDHDWLGIRVLSDSDDNPDPEILKPSNLRRGDLDLPIDADSVLKRSREEDKFHDVLFGVIKKLSEVMPEVFGDETENIDFLVPDNLLGAGGLVNEVLKLPVECFERVEVIGWLYQYYNQAEKDIAMKKKSAIEKDEIPYVTQIFTPDWIVKYMVENSLGRYWLDHGGDPSLANNWKYLIKGNESKTPKPGTLPNIEEVTFIDPCMGSGHILVYAFEVFYQIYQSLGYPADQIPEKILTHNLYGLDIDDRAMQLSILSALLVARSYDKKLFHKQLDLNMTAVAESNGMSGLSELLKGASKDTAEYLVDIFRDAKEYGSILRVKSDDYDKLVEDIETLPPMDKLLYLERTKHLIKQARILSKKYSVAVTNPPYMNKYDAKLKTYVNNYYPESKSDLFGVFNEVLLDHVNEGGYTGMITPDSWMFLKSYAGLRENIFNDAHIATMYHLDYIFPDVVVHTTAFTIKKDNTSDTLGDYVRLVDVNNLDTKPQIAIDSSKDPESERRFLASNDDFAIFPGKIIAYWATESMKKSFIESERLDPNFAHANTGIMTGDNGRFIRLWWETSNIKLMFDAADANSAQQSGKKWFPYNKGGEFRRWYGNNDYVVNWYDDGKEIFSRFDGEKRFSQNIPRQYRFAPTLTWSKISTGSIAFRYKPAGHLFDIAGASLFSDEETLKYLQGILNSSIIRKFASVISPTLNFESGQVGSYPVIKSAEHKFEVTNLVEQCRDLSKTDWDSFETSWDFEKHPLIPANNETKLSETYSAWDKTSETRWNKLKSNEERLNEIFIEVYGMQDELTPEVEDKYVTVRKADKTREAKSLLSYFVGVIFGRYSLDKPGINFAGGDWSASHQSKLVDGDNIVPIMDSEYYTDDIVKKLRDFLTEVYGDQTLGENLNWLADAIGRRATENAEDAIRRYFVNDFFADHFKTYSKRPIYWLLSSGKDNGFKALFYLHRYQPNLMATVRTKYLLSTQNIYSKRLAELEDKPTLNNEELRLKNDLTAKLAEIKNYDALIAVAASKSIDLDLDDGVKENYPKLSEVADDVKPGSQILAMKGVKL